MSSRRPSLDYPEVPLYQALEGAARRWPDRDALVAGEARLSYAQLDEQASRFGAALAKILLVG